MIDCMHMNTVKLGDEEKALITVTRGVKDLIKINSAYRRMSMAAYIEMLVIKDLDLKE